ncbi:unnamed protein product [Mesocestoides corti]|uniref:Acetyltransferase component of pyruvate dehydrogenase complex n=1 Tax=Mesocestoides corti TaxID=53468 RepID=A0A0R3ULE3_MESCO|nr:unnamed protein product [Mesocestoides corti]
MVNLPPSNHVLVGLPQNYLKFSRFFSSLPPHVVVKLPNLSPTMETGNVVSWAKNEGDQVGEGDLLAEIETDKATMSMDSSDEGYVAKILIPAGTKNVPVGSPLVVIVGDEASVGAFKDYQPEAGAAPPPTASAAAPPPPPPPPPPAAQPATPVTPPAVSAAPPAAKPVSPPSGDRVFISPLARRVARERGIDLSLLTGTGSGVDGCFVLADLDNLAAFAPTPTSTWTDIPTTGMRANLVLLTLQTIAKRLAESKQTIPHYYLTVDIELDELLKFRDSVNASLAKLAVPGEKPAKISVNDVFIKAMALANKRVPDCNSSWMGDFIRRYDSADVCVAVATPTGLITPIIFNADTKGLLTISQEVRDLAARARDNKLKPEEFQGGTITISNLGMFGISSFSAIINPPQACILSVGTSHQVVVPDEGCCHKTVTKVSVTLCCDHRVVDGAVGATWLKEFKSFIESPASMLL